MKKEVRQYDIDEEGFLGVQAISLVEFPAIEVDFIALSKEKKVKLSDIQEERKMVYGAALIPDKLIYREDGDGTPYYAQFTSKLIEKVAHNFLLKNLQHNHTVEHTFAVTGLTVVESWLKEGESDKSVGLGFELPVGTWFVGVKVDNEEVWQQVKEGKIKGFSIEGFFNEVGVEMSRGEIRENWANEIDNYLSSL
jgi:hypothetical protein